MVARKSKAETAGTVRPAAPVREMPAAARPTAPAPRVGKIALPLRTMALPAIIFLIGILMIVPILSLARVIGGITPLVLLAGALVGLILLAYFSMRKIYKGVLTE